MTNEGNENRQPEPIQAWVDGLVQQLGRPPRILHIGNYANNAYHNAKRLNRIGCDCDVLAFDYYHIMSSPEWEDADLRGDVGDEYFPRWLNVDLQGYERPRWHAGGPLHYASHYLLARRGDDELLAEILWYLLRVALDAVSHHKATDPGSYRPECLDFIAELRRAVLRSSPSPRTSLFKSLWSSWRRPTANSSDGPLSPAVRENYLAPLIASLLRTSEAGPAPESLVKALDGAHEIATLGTVRTGWESALDINGRTATLIDSFQELYPGVSPSLTAEDLTPYINYDLGLFRDLFLQYDVIQAYCADPIFPLLLGVRPWVAYETGTLRELPFEDSGRARLLRLSYALADAVYLTNADILPRAREILPSPRTIVCGLHGFDETSMRDHQPIDRTQARLGVADGYTLFLSPSRHFWVGESDWGMKGNDMIVRAAKSVAAAHPDSFRVIFVDWGKDVENTKELIAELELEQYFRWVQPVHKQHLLKVYRSVDCVLDQFVVPAMGGITFEAILAAGVPVATRLDDAAMAEFYGETVPLFNCSSVEGLVRVMSDVITNAPGVQTVKTQCARWMDVHHRDLNYLQTAIEAYSLCGLEPRTAQHRIRTS